MSSATPRSRLAQGRPEDGRIESRAWIRLDPPNSHAAVSSTLELLQTYSGTQYAPSLGVHDTPCWIGSDRARRAPPRGVWSGGRGRRSRLRTERRRTTARRRRPQALPGLRAPLPRARTVPDREPLGEVKRAYTTFYDADGTGNCSFPASSNQNLLVVAPHKERHYDGSAVCGACMRVTGRKGSVVVRVVNSCPVDTSERRTAATRTRIWILSAQAFARIEDPDVGITNVSFQLDPSARSPARCSSDSVGGARVEDRGARCSTSREADPEVGECSHNGPWLAMNGRTTTLRRPRRRRRAPTGPPPPDHVDQRQGRGRDAADRRQRDAQR